MGWLLVGFLFYIFLVVAERAIVAVTPYELEMFRAEGTPSARRILSIAGDNNRRSLAALSLSRTFLMVLMSMSLILFLFQQRQLNALIGNESAEVKLTPTLLWAALGVFITAIFSFLLFKTGSISFSSPKQRRLATFWLVRLHRLIQACTLVFFPFLPKKESILPTQNIMSTDPIEREAEVGKKRDIEMLKSIARFGDVTVRQVMQPQLKMVMLEMGSDFRKILQVIRQSGFSRLPVVEEDIDHITGILYIKDIVAYADMPASFDWHTYIRKDFLIVPEVKPISELLKEFKKKKKHLAIVVDEYGGTAGLVTLEDILEEVTGEIRDEFDEENEIPPYKQINSSTFLFSGTTMINDVCQIAGIHPDAFEEVRNDADTIAGLLLNLTGDIPQKGEQASWEQYLFTVERANNRRVEQVRFEIIAE